MDFRIESDTAARRAAAYREKLSALAAEFASRGVRLIDWRELLPAFAGLSCDFVHPSTEGHTLIAERLCTQLPALGLS